MSAHRNVRVAAVVIGVIGLVVVAGRLTGSAAERMERRSLVSDAERRPSPASPRYARAPDSLTLRRDSVLGVNRFAVLAIGAVAHEFDVRALPGFSAPTRAGGERPGDSALVRVVRDRDTLVVHTGEVLRVRPPVLLLVSPHVNQFTVTTGDPTRAIELRVSNPLGGAAPRRPLWSGRIQGWRMALRRTGPMREFVPLADAVELVPPSTGPRPNPPGGSPR